MARVLRPAPPRREVRERGPYLETNIQRLVGWMRKEFPTVADEAEGILRRENKVTFVNKVDARILRIHHSTRPTRLNKVPPSDPAEKRDVDNRIERWRDVPQLFLRTVFIEDEFSDASLARLGAAIDAFHELEVEAGPTVETLPPPTNQAQLLDDLNLLIRRITLQRAAPPDVATRPLVALWPTGDWRPYVQEHWLERFLRALFVMGDILRTMPVLVHALEGMAGSGVDPVKMFRDFKERAWIGMERDAQTSGRPLARALKHIYLQVLERYRRDAALKYDEVAQALVELDTARSSDPTAATQEIQRRRGQLLAQLNNIVTDADAINALNALVAAVNTGHDDPPLVAFGPPPPQPVPPAAAEDEREEEEEEEAAAPAPFVEEHENVEVDMDARAVYRLVAADIANADLIEDFVDIAETSAPVDALNVRLADFRVAAQRRLTVDEYLVAREADAQNLKVLVATIVVTGTQWPPLDWQRELAFERAMTPGYLSWLEARDARFSGAWFNCCRRYVPRPLRRAFGLLRHDPREWRMHREITLIYSSLQRRAVALWLHWLGRSVEVRLKIMPPSPLVETSMFLPPLPPPTFAPRRCRPENRPT